MTQKLTDKDIAMRFEEAVYTLKRLPKPYVMGFHTLWPPIVYTTWEIQQQEKKPLRLGPPMPAAIDRMEETFKWIAWLEVEERQIVWLRASRLPWKAICTRVGLSRTAATKHWLIAMLKIAKRHNGIKTRRSTAAGV